VFIHANNTLAIVPLHPGDKPGKMPLNLAQGAYPIQAGMIGKSMIATNNEKWVVQKNAQVSGLAANSAAATVPSRVVRTMASTSSPAKNPSTSGHYSTIVYDANEHRFVNSAAVTSAQGKTVPSGTGSANSLVERTTAAPKNVPSAARATEQPVAARGASLPPRPTVAPAPAHTSSRSSSFAGGWSGGSGSGAAASSSVGSTSSSSARSSSLGSAHPH
jgi:hypothetical protein